MPIPQAVREKRDKTFFESPSILSRDPPPRSESRRAGGIGKER
jgi:hypothetical protein